jgi:tRNA A-37 threonylcarbamoyl transferase component Bud32
MILYSSNNKQLDSKNFKYLNSGNCSTVSKHGDIVLKIYKIDCKSIYRLNKSMFKQLKKLDDPNLVRLRNMYYHYKATAYKLSSIDAYTMDYIKLLPQRITDLDRQQLLELFLSLDETLRRLSENKIVLRDVHTKNIIINPDRIIILDPDMFYTLKTKSKSKIYSLNKNILLFAINSIIEYETIQNEDKLIPPFFSNNSKLSLYDEVKSTLTEDTIKQKIKVNISNN